jgi:DNA repair protein RadC
MKELTLFPQLLISEVKLIYLTKVKSSDRPQIKCSRDAFEILINVYDRNCIEHHEEFLLLLLNRSNKVLGATKISQGGTSGTITDVKIIMQYAIKGNASGIIISHNHPSGNLNPSESDTRITQKIKQAGEILDIQLLDHLIITADNEFYSFADNGLL